MKNLHDESGRQELLDLLTDGPVLLLIEVAQPLLHRFGAGPDVQGVLSDISQNTWQIRGSPREHVTIHTEEVDEQEFLFGRQGGADMHRPTVRAARVEGKHLDPLGGLERADGPIGVGHVTEPPNSYKIKYDGPR
jgi:hypothetical protein